MAFNTYNQFTGNRKSWDHVGNKIPTYEYSEGVRPAGTYLPAAWLPVQFYDKKFEDWYTILPGKPVAFDNQNRVVPAGYGVSGATITYTANDVSEGVIDVRTGSALLTAAIGTFNVSAVTDFMGTGVAMAVSKPAGVAQYAVHKWAGDGSALDDGTNPAAFTQTNYQRQSAVAFCCDYVYQYPIVPETTASGEALEEDSYADNVHTFVALDNLPVATVTQRTPITFANDGETDAATRFVNQVGTVAAIRSAGDWHIDYATGVVSAYGTGALGAGSLYAVTYSHYASAPTGTSVSKFASVLGDVSAGDFVKINAEGNLVKANPATDSFFDVVGQILMVADAQNRSLLGSVRTGYNPPIGTSATGALPGYDGQLDQMPGSATGGVPSLLHYAGAANLLAVVNLIGK